MNLSKAVRSTLLAVALSSSASMAADYTIDTLASGLDNPWSIAQLPNGNFLVTEKPGALLIISETGDRQSVTGVPEVFYASQGGLLDVLVHPDFSENQTIFLSYAGGNAKDNRTTVARAQLENGALTNLTILLEVSPSKDTAAHYGGKLALQGDGTLLVSVGEGFQYREEAQNLSNEMGKLLRIHQDGTAPADNPFPEQAPRVLSYGHRNPQGLAIDNEAGLTYMSEHGPKGGDELNIISAGKNYGWPAITYGVDYSGAIISPYSEAPGMEQPETYWVPSIGPSGLAVIRGEGFDDWQGDLLTGALVDQKLFRLDMEDGRFIGQSEPFPELEGRVRDVRVFDGVIYVVTDEGAVYRITAG